MDWKTVFTESEIEMIVKDVHETNKRFCEALGDESQVSWEEAPEWQKSSCLVGVHAILDGTVTKPSDSHQSWMKHKLLEGWKYGPIKDVDKKEHPCMVDYDELPFEQKTKDAIFFSIVTSAIKRKQAIIGQD